MLKHTILLTAFAGLFFSAAPAMGDATWTGLGATDNWSDMSNWNGDPTAGGNWYLNSLSSTFTSICNVHTLNDWGQGHSGRLYLNEHARLYIPTGGYLDRERFKANADSEIHIDGGTFKADCRPPGHQYIEITDGTWSAARWTYMTSPGVGTLHIVGSDPDQVHLNGFVSWNYNSTPTLQYTLDANGVTPFSIGGEGEFHPHNQQSIDGFITIEVAGIDDYLAGVGNVGDVIDLVVCSSGLNYPTAANWTTGLVDDGKGLVSVHANGVTLEVLGGGPTDVIPEPSTLVIWALGLLALALYARRRRK